jgi:hypothetical protein
MFTQFIGVCEICFEINILAQRLDIKIEEKLTFNINLNLLKRHILEEQIT